MINFGMLPFLRMIKCLAAKITVILPTYGDKVAFVF